MRIVKIGNTYGIRIPKLLLDQLNLSGDVELEVENDRLIIHSAKPARHGSEAQFRQLAQGDELPLDTTTATLTTWDEWEW